MTLRMARDGFASYPALLAERSRIVMEQELAERHRIRLAILKLRNNMSKALNTSGSRRGWRFRSWWRPRLDQVAEHPFEGYDGFQEWRVAEQERECSQIIPGKEYAAQVSAWEGRGSIMAVHAPDETRPDQYASRPAACVSGSLYLLAKQRSSESQLLDKAWLKVATKFFDEVDDVDPASLDYSYYDDKMVTYATWSWPTGSMTSGL